METLWENGQYGTSRNYRRALNSFSAFLDGDDIPFHRWIPPWRVGMSHGCGNKGSEKQQLVLYADSACRL